MNQHLTYIKPKLEKYTSALWGWFKGDQGPGITINIDLNEPKIFSSRGQEINLIPFFTHKLMKLRDVLLI